ncbi:hypothetical protein ABKN59_008744 [Abortiporus biennis]
MEASHRQRRKLKLLPRSIPIVEQKPTAAAAAPPPPTKAVGSSNTSRDLVTNTSVNPYDDDDDWIPPSYSEPDNQETWSNGPWPIPSRYTSVLNCLQKTRTKRSLRNPGRCGICGDRVELEGLEGRVDHGVEKNHFIFRCNAPETLADGRSCKTAFLSEESRDMHVKSKHQKQDMEKCPECSQSFISVDALTKHLRKKYPSSEHVIEYVPPSSTLKSRGGTRTKQAKSEMKEHIDAGVSTAECKMCHQAFLNKKDLIRHINWEHTQQCPDCGGRFSKTFFDDDTMAQHRLWVHDIKIECRSCGAQFSNWNRFKSHRQSKCVDIPNDSPEAHDDHIFGVHEFACPELHCRGINFDNAYSLEDHITHVHRRCCEGCFELFNFSFELEKHLESCLRVCETCNEVLVNQVQLDEHMWNKHPKILLLCPCGQEYFYEQTQEHLDSTHTPHPKCKFCWIGFADTNELDKHLEMHCGWCDELLVAECSRHNEGLRIPVPNEELFRKSELPNSLSSQETSYSPGDTTQFEQEIELHYSLWSRVSLQTQNVQKFLNQDLVEPVVTSCGHMFCKRCLLDQLLKSSDFGCPVYVDVVFDVLLFVESDMIVGSNSLSLGVWDYEDLYVVLCTITLLVSCINGTCAVRVGISKLRIINSTKMDNRTHGFDFQLPYIAKPLRSKVMLFINRSERGQYVYVIKGCANINYSSTALR